MIPGSTTEVKELIEISKEILRWLKISNITKVKEMLDTILNTDEKKFVYNLSDGNIGTIALEEMTGVSKSTIPRWWLSWFKLGLMEPIAVRGGTRYKKLFDLSDFGIIVPSLPPKDIIKQKEVVNNE